MKLSSMATATILKRSYSTVLLLIFLAVSAAAQQAAPRRPARFQFGVIGDQGYTPETEAQFPAIMAELNRANLAFIIHVGDFRGGYPPCSDETFEKRKAEFAASAHPFIYTPGDNEWTDCRNSPDELYSLNRLAKLREIFFNTERSLGKKKLTLARQSEEPNFQKYSVNARWMYGGLLFATLHIVGSNNNFGRTPEMDAEFRERTAANLAWLRQAFDLAKRQSAPAIVLITQADPRFERRWLRNGTPGTPDPASGFNEILTALRSETISFGKPVLFIHGDLHYFIVDKPMFDTSEAGGAAPPGRMVENFTRLEGFGHPNSHWVRVLVDSRDANVFSFQPQIVDVNRVRR